MTDTKEYLLLGVTSFVLVSILIFLFSTGGLMTGFTVSTFDVENTFLVNSFFDENEILNFEQQDVTSFTIFGNFIGYGEARVLLNTSEGEILIYEVQNLPDSSEASHYYVEEDFVPSVLFLESDFNNSEEDSSNDVNESVDDVEESIDETEANETEDDLNETVVDEVNETINETTDDLINDSINESEELVNNTIIEDINETINESVNESEELVNDTIIEDINETEEETEEPVTSINNECIDTCSLNNVEVYNVIVEVNGGVLEINSFKYTKQSSSPTTITQTQEFNDQQILLNQTLTYDLSEYFEGDITSFDVRNSNGYNYTLEDNILTLTPLELGNWRSRVYAIGDEVIESNDFIIEIVDQLDLPEVIENITEENITDINETINDSITENITEPINQTINESINETLNETIIEEINETINESENETEIITTTEFESRQENLPTSDLQGIIEQGQQVTILKNYHRVEPLNRNDVVTYNHVTSRSPLYKVLIGVPGDELAWNSNDDLTINGEVITNTLGEPYSLTERQKNIMHLYVRGYGTIPEDTYLILTNNPSRPRGSADYGLMHIDNFEGKVTW